MSNASRSAADRALKYLRKAPRITISDLKDNPGARTTGRQVRKQDNQAGKSHSELRGAAKPPLGWIWGNFYMPWQRVYPGEERYNQDINLRREYPPLSLVELQRLIDLGWIDTSKPIDLTTLCNTRRYKCDPLQRQFGVQLTDEGADIFSAKVNLEVQYASETVIAAVERAGGHITTAYYDPVALIAVVNPMEWFKRGEPIPRRRYPPADLLDYYTDPRARGYLSDPAKIEEERRLLAAKMCYSIDCTSDEDEPTLLAVRKHPLQVFHGLSPGWLVNLADRTLLKPTDQHIFQYYNGQHDDDDDGFVDNNNNSNSNSDIENDLKAGS